MGDRRTLVEIQKDYIPHKNRNYGFNKYHFDTHDLRWDTTKKDKSIMMKTFRASTREVFHGKDRENHHGVQLFRATGNFHTHNVG